MLWNSSYMIWYLILMIFFLERWYTDKHEWITVDDKTGIVGISDYAQDALGDVVYAQLPDVGSMVKKEGKILSHLTIRF